MAKVATTVVSSIAAPRKPFYAWLVPGVFYNQLETVLRDAAGLPGVASTSGTTGPWDVAGSTRVVHLTDGTSCRETVKVATAPDYFAYQLTEFSSRLVGGLVRQAGGQWWFTDEGAGTHAKWTYTAESRNLLTYPLLYPVIKILWHRYMAAAMAVTKARAEREVAGERAMTSWDFDLEALHGPQEMTDEDRGYRGSRFSEVRAALYANPYRDGASGQAPGPLPMFRSTIRNAWRGALRGPNKLKQASARAIDSRADLRWGDNRKGYRRILAPNGICALGTWEITESSPFTGYFAKGAKGLTIARFSSDGNETQRGQRRSISLGMKIYPTTDPHHQDLLVPASVIAQEDLGGMHTAYINDADLRNAPNVTAYRRGIYMLILVHAGLIFQGLDKIADSRQLHEVGELGTPAGQPAHTPAHMLLRMTPGQRRVEGDGLDFRDEIYGHIFPNGGAEPTGSMEYDIFVSDNGRRSGLPGLFQVTVTDWQPIGRLRFTEAICSYNADHVVQFHHPGWRDDRNDPSTAIRARETRVR